MLSMPDDNESHWSTDAVDQDAPASSHDGAAATHGVPRTDPKGKSGNSKAPTVFNPLTQSHPGVQHLTSLLDKSASDLEPPVLVISHNAQPPWDWQDYLGSAYLWPPVGGFWTHNSTTCSSPARPVDLHHHFNHGWTQEGTRRREAGHVHRRICRFTREGPAEFYGNPVGCQSSLRPSCGARSRHLGRQTRAAGFATTTTESR